MDGEAWWATVHGVTKSQTRLSDFTMKGQIRHGIAITHQPINVIPLILRVY